MYDCISICMQGAVDNTGLECKIQMAAGLWVNLLGNNITPAQPPPPPSPPPHRPLCLIYSPFICLSPLLLLSQYSSWQQLADLTMYPNSKLAPLPLCLTLGHQQVSNWNHQTNNSKILFYFLKILTLLCCVVIKLADGNTQSHFILYDIFKSAPKSNTLPNASTADVTDLGAWRSTDVPFTVHSLGSASLPVSGDLMRLNDTFWTHHVILTGCTHTYTHKGTEQ